MALFNLSILTRCWLGWRHQHSTAMADTGDKVALSHLTQLVRDIVLRMRCF